MLDDSYTAMLYKSTPKRRRNLVLKCWVLVPGLSETLIAEISWMRVLMSVLMLSFLP